MTQKLNLDAAWPHPAKHPPPRPDDRCYLYCAECSREFNANFNSGPYLHYQTWHWRRRKADLILGAKGQPVLSAWIYEFTCSICSSHWLSRNTHQEVEPIPKSNIAKPPATPS